MRLPLRPATIRKPLATTRRTASLLLAIYAPLSGTAGAQSLSPVPSIAQSPAQPTVMIADTPSKTPSGATFTVPKGWSLSSMPQFVVATAPEGDAHIAIVDIAAAAGGAAAAAQAWLLYKPAGQHPVKLVTPSPARNGWDEISSVEYEVSPNEKADIEAVALRSGTHWTVFIVDSSQATAEKRAAGIGLIGQTLRPAGYTRESFAGRTAHPLDAARIEAMKSFVRTSMKQLGIPGASMALYDRGSVVFEGGFGVRELGKPAPVDAHTLFMIASNTKGMSTLLLSELVDRGKLDWDEKVTRVYPAFRLGSAATTQKVLIRNLVCACTGLPRKDFDWIFDTTRTTPATTTFAQLALTEPTSGFGEVFQYNNLMASAAGYIAGHIEYPDREIGAAYDAAMQTMIFDPLGMHDTTLSMSRALASDHASAHGDDVDGHPAVADMDFNYAVVPYRPAGGAWSSAHDLIKYVANEIALGELPNGKRLVSEKNLLVRRAPGVSVGEDSWYGMGLMGTTRYGVPVVHHGGSMAGFKSDIILLPDAGVGAVILTNADNGEDLLRPFMRRLLEVLYDGKPEAADDVAAAAASTKAEIAKDRLRLVVPPAKPAVAALANRYTNADLGHVTVLRHPGEVVFDFGLWKSQVASRVNDDGTTSFITISPAVNGFEFVVEKRGAKRALVLRDGQHEYVYTEAD